MVNTIRKGSCNEDLKILYDITRLIRRVKSGMRTPTGIDRVDFEMSNYLYRNFGKSKVAYIYIHDDGDFCLLDYRQVGIFLDEIMKSWKKNTINETSPRIPHVKKNKIYDRSDKYRIDSIRDVFVETAYWFKRVYNAKPNKALWGKVKWINRLPNYIKKPILLLSAIEYSLYKFIYNIIIFIVRRNKKTKREEPAPLHGLNRKLSVYFLGKNENIVYLNISHHNLNRGYILESVKAFGYKVVTFIHDIIPISHPEFVREGDSNIHRERLLNALSYSDLILTNSEYTKKSIISFCSQENISFSPEIEVITLGVNDYFINKIRKNNKKYKEKSEFQYPEKPYFLIIGTIEPRKNIDMITSVWREFYKMNLNGCLKEIPQLIIIGNYGWEYECVKRVLEKSMVSRYITVMNNVDDLKLVSFLERAQALLFPSFVEGWGMPAAEACALGVPVIASDAEALKEATQGLSLYINPIDGLNWRDTILEMAKYDSKIRRKICLKLQKYELCTWEEFCLHVIQTIGNIK